MFSVSELPEELEHTFEFFQHLIAEFEMAGFVFTFSLIALLQWAAEQAITLGKFTYEYIGGGLGTTPLGSSPLGEGGYTEIREIPDEDI
ncbi:hypothetical protein DU484_06205 [Haloplanus rubicundus]|uniref:Uncharacterized protein n=2 Tax=Haloplanus rubicundus TaxID=1547898 RepID=A0A345EBC1_9EURY|nr:hypothetical protein DU484_06205 [Haloplanus rubicundus]